MSDGTYLAPDHIRPLMDKASDHAIHEMLQQIGATVDDDGSIDLNAIMRRAVPYALFSFLINCPQADLVAMQKSLVEGVERLKPRQPEGDT